MSTDAPYAILECASDVSERTWALIDDGVSAAGNFLIADVTDGSPRVEGRYDASTGDVFAGGAHTPGEEPAVHVIGPLAGDTGQVTVRQEKGNYLRICRWDRLSPDSGVEALLRTLPQCGCGGSLGAPKLFDSFAEMSAYHFCAFYL